MPRFILVSHGHLAERMKDTLRIILGQLDNVDTLCTYVDPDITIRAKIGAPFARYAPEDTLVVMTDIFGGPVNNEFMSYLSEREFFLVCGMNMPLLVQLLSSDSLVAQDISEAIAESRDAILLCNDLEVAAEEAEDF